MKIRLLQPRPEFQPDHQGFLWPPRNGESGGDHGVEDNFYDWALTRPDLFVANPYVTPAAVDWAYAPFFFNRLFINTPDEDGHWGGTKAARDSWQAEIDRLWHSWRGPWFTVAEADIAVIQPYLDLHGMVIFTASRRGESGIDIPLLSAPHPVPASLPPKRKLATFLGHMQTDGIRIRMGEALAGRDDCRVEHANYGPDVFAHALLESYIALAPRGQGAQSFRFYEAMQLGVAPLYLSDVDARPFKRWIDWDSCSLYRPNCEGLSDYLDGLDRADLLAMGEEAARVYREQLAYGQWCRYVVRELEQR